MKPALFFTLHGGRHDTRWGILAVTLEKARQLYGWDQGGHPTHVAPRDTVGHFDTLELAEKAVAALDLIVSNYAPAVEARHVAIANAVDGLRK